MKKIMTIFIAILFISVNSLSLSAASVAIPDIANLDLTKPSGFTAEQLREGLLYKLKPLAEDFIRAERLYGVNAVFLASLAGVESGWGQYCFLPNNLFGWGSRSYSSPSACIDEVARLIKTWYLTDPSQNPNAGRYFSGYTVRDVNRYYNGRGEWAQKVEGVMYDIYTRIGECPEAAVVPKERMLRNYQPGISSRNINDFSFLRKLP